MLTMAKQLLILVNQLPLKLRSSIMAPLIMQANLNMILITMLNTILTHTKQPTTIIHPMETILVVMHILATVLQDQLKMMQVFTQIQLIMAQQKLNLIVLKII